MPSPDAVNCRGRHLLSELDWGAAPGDLPGGGLRPDWLVPLMSLLLLVSPDWISAATPPTRPVQVNPLELPMEPPFSAALLLLYPCGAASALLTQSPCLTGHSLCNLGQLSAERCHVLLPLNVSHFGRFSYPFLAKNGPSLEFSSPESAPPTSAGCHGDHVSSGSPLHL